MQNITATTPMNITGIQQTSPVISAPSNKATETPVSQDTATSPSSKKQLQPDQLALSDEAKEKLAEAEEKDKEDKKDIDTSSLNGAKTAEEAAAADKAKEGDLDKQIRELSMVILELSVEIQMLQDKEDSESVKERQKLEVDLAIKKGQLEATMERKIQSAAS